MHVPQFLPVSTLQRTYNAVVSKLANGPVFLSQKSKPIAVMLSTNDYERLAQAEVELKRLKRLAKYDRDFAEMRAGNYTDLDDLLAGDNANPSK